MRLKTVLPEDTLAACWHLPQSLHALHTKHKQISVAMRLCDHRNPTDYFMSLASSIETVLDLEQRFIQVGVTQLLQRSICQQFGCSTWGLLLAMLCQLSMPQAIR